MRWRSPTCATLVGTAALFALAGCGGGSRQDVNEPTGNFTVQVSTVRFPASQHLSQHTHFVIIVHNVGTKAIPNLAVTICNVTCVYSAHNQNVGTATQAFSQNLNMAHLASSSRPVWVVDRPPGPCGNGCTPTGPNGGGTAGGYVTAYSNTWALGHPLQPGTTATFDWGVTAVSPGRHVVAWQLAAGLNGKAKAVLQDGAVPRGAFTVVIHTAPQQSCVTNNLKITTHCQAGT